MDNIKTLAEQIIEIKAHNAEALEALQRVKEAQGQRYVTPLEVYRELVSRSRGNVSDHERVMLLQEARHWYRVAMDAQAVGEING